MSWMADQIAKYICSCQNIDGGFGSIPEARATPEWCSVPRAH